MKPSGSFLAIALTFSLYSIAFLNFTVQPIFAQQQADSKIAIQRGYRTGYSDGYMAGYRDTIDNATKNFSKHAEYEKADRAFNKDYGVLEDYRDGYRQGFETGYDTGFEKRSFDATIPVNLNKRGIAAIPVISATNVTKTVVVEESASVKTIETPVVNTPTENTAVVNVPVEQPRQVSENTAPETSAQLPVMTAKIDVSEAQKPNYTPVSYDETTVTIPTETELIVELIDNIDTGRSREGDKFQARIVSPTEIGGAIIEGRITKIQKPGRIKRRAEMLLSFDRIVLPNNRWSNFNAVVTEVLPVRGDNVKRVDSEGTVEGKSSVKDDSIKVGAATGTGLVVGAIAGGPVGAAVGATVGAAFGAGAAIVERGKDIKLNKNQQLRIKTAYETQIR
jgi:hypothetical protein